MTTLHLCLTMDVERIAMYSPSGGPRTWKDAERSVRSYCEILAAYDLPATLFIVPDAAMVQGAIFRELERSTGAELGMHFHPQCWRDHYLNPAAYEYLGGYAAEQQYHLLAAALEQTSEGLGARPYAFRGGNFSANDSTFAVLADLGFTHGSVSQPGRVAPQYRAVWAGADPDVHRAHRTFRLIAGDLDIVEVPLTSDRARTDHWSGVGDVRFETASAPQIVIAVRQEVQRQIATGAPFLHACLMTHNFVDYSSDDLAIDGRRGVLLEAIIAIREYAEEQGLALRGATISEARRAFLNLTGASAPHPPDHTR